MQQGADPSSRRRQVVQSLHRLAPLRHPAGQNDCDSMAVIEKNERVVSTATAASNALHV